MGIILLRRVSWVLALGSLCINLLILTLGLKNSWFFLSTYNFMSYSLRHKFMSINFRRENTQILFSHPKYHVLDLRYFCTRLKNINLRTKDFKNFPLTLMSWLGFVQNFGVLSFEGVGREKYFLHIKSSWVLNSKILTFGKQNSWFSSLAGDFVRAFQQNSWVLTLGRKHMNNNVFLWFIAFSP